MIKVSALLVALAIGLLVAGVVGSSLLMVYVSIGVCAVAALLLAVGVLSHWSEIFGRREPRPASAPGAWSEPQVNVTAPVLASIQAAAAARGSVLPGHEEAGVRRAGARPDDRPAEVVPSPAEVAGSGDESVAPRRGDDLWERVEEELGSAAKRDTGALSWPGTVFPPMPPDGLAPAGQPAAPAPQGEPGAGTSAWIWGSGAGWRPPQTADPAWPPPAVAFAEPKAAPESGAPGSAAAEPVAAEPAEPAAVEPGGPEETDRTPVPGEPAADADVAEDTDVAEDAEASSGDGAVPDDDAAPDDDAPPDDDAALEDSAAQDDGVAPEAKDQMAAGHAAAGPAPQRPPWKSAAGEGRPQWIIAAPRPAGHEPAAESPAQAADADDSGAEDPDTDDQGTDDPDTGESAAQQSAAQEPAAEEQAVGAPGAPEPAADEPAGDGAAAEQAPGRVEVTVVPGVARYHRSECILIRFLGAGDLEIMTRQEAEDATMMACRACQPDQLED